MFLPIWDRRHRWCLPSPSSGADSTPPSPSTGARPGPLADTTDVARTLERLKGVSGTDLALAVQNVSVPPPNRGVLYLGMNPESASTEIGALSRTAKVRALTDAAASFVIIAGVRYDLSDPARLAERARAIVDTLGVDPRTASAVVDVIALAEPGARGKLAQLAAVFADAERGHPIPSRLVISAHCGGTTFFGMSGELAVRDLHRLAMAMPRAARCIEDVHLSACSTSGQAGLSTERAAWLAAFPNLKTLWTYAGSSSLAPTRHLHAWAQMTAGDHDSLWPSKELENERVATWSRQAGYHDDIPIATLRKRQTLADKRFERFLSGELSADERALDSQHADALLDYEAYRVLSQKNELSAAERAPLARRADQLLRIRYYAEGVRTAFAERHDAALRAGLATVGIQANFRAMSRREALTTIALFESKVATLQPVPPIAARLLPLLRGFRDLDPHVVPTADCQRRVK